MWRDSGLAHPRATSAFVVVGDAPDQYKLLYFLPPSEKKSLSKKFHLVNNFFTNNDDTQHRCDD
jgi:hypothetical protein